MIPPEPSYLIVSPLDDLQVRILHQPGPIEHVLLSTAIGAPYFARNLISRSLAKADEDSTITETNLLEVMVARPLVVFGASISPSENHNMQSERTLHSRLDRKETDRPELFSCCTTASAPVPQARSAKANVVCAFAPVAAIVRINFIRRYLIVRASQIVKNGLKVIELVFKSGSDQT